MRRLYHAPGARPPWPGARMQPPPSLPRFRSRRHAAPDRHHSPLALWHNLAAAAPQRPTPRSGPWSRPTPTGMASSACMRGCAAPTACAMLDLARPSDCAPWAGAAPAAAGGRVRAARPGAVLAPGIWHAVHCDEQIDWLAAHKTQVPHRVFLKMNSGMNRLGFTPAAGYRGAWGGCRRCRRSMKSRT